MTGLELREKVMWMKRAKWEIMKAFAFFHSFVFQLDELGRGSTRGKWKTFHCGTLLYFLSLIPFRN